jgi:hypothetical protein
MKGMLRGITGPSECTFFNVYCLYTTQGASGTEIQNTHTHTTSIVHGKS